MRRNLYIALFVAILLIACVGGFWGGRILLNRMQQDFVPRPRITSTAAESTDIAFADTPLAEASPLVEVQETPALQDGGAGEQPQPSPTIFEVPAPVTDQPAVLTTPEPTWTAGVELPTAEFSLMTDTPDPIEELTPAPSVTPMPAFPFVLAHAVRYSRGDCPGTYALGVVTDRNGNPLAGIRLNLVDEFGNAATAVTKPGPGDTGRYDFPMGGPPRRFYMTVVDEGGRAISPRVEILHDLAPQEGNTCRWIDWRRN